MERSGQCGSAGLRDYGSVHVRACRFIAFPSSMCFNLSEGPSLECQPHCTSVFEVVPSVGGEVKSCADRFEPWVDRSLFDVKNECVWGRRCGIGRVENCEGEMCGG